MSGQMGRVRYFKTRSSTIYMFRGQYTYAFNEKAEKCVNAQ